MVQKRYQRFEDYDPAVDAPDVDPFAAPLRSKLADLYRKPMQGPPMPGTTGDATAVKSTSSRDALTNAMAGLAEGLTGKDYSEARRDSGTLLSLAPGTGTAISAEDAASDLGKGDYLGAGINALGAIPELGPAAKAMLIGTPAYRRLAEEMMAKTGKNIEWFHPVGGGVKLRDPFSELTSTTRPTGPMLPDKTMSPEDFKVGSYLLPLYGDKTVAGKTLLDVQGKPLATPQKLGGGGRFMQENPGKLWASDQGKGTTVSGKVQRLEQESGLPVLGTHVSMGTGGSDFAKMNARTALQLTDQKAISDEAAKAFDARMAENWPGIKNVDPEEWLATAPGGQRADLVKAMQLSPFQRDPAFANIGAIRKATTEPELMHEPMLTSGMSVGQFAPGGKVDPGAGTHESYNTDWLGQHLGNMGQVPFSVMFPDVARNFALKNPEQVSNLPALGYSVERQIPEQKITAQWQDNFMKWLEGQSR